jgi:hypothetical protein
MDVVYIPVRATCNFNQAIQLVPENPSLLTLIFAFLSVVFFLLLIFFRTPFTLQSLVRDQDALDLLTPLVLIPIY